MAATVALAEEIGVVAACKGMDVALATYHRAKKQSVPIHTVRRPRASPLALTAQEREIMLDTLHAPEYVDASPHTVYAKLLDEGVYLGSVSTMYRLLHAHSGTRKRRNELTHPTYAKPELLATKPCEVWSWDITKLKGPVKLAHYHLYVIIDIFSRYVVGWMVADCERDELAKALIEQTCERQSITSDQLTLHADRGASMRSKLVADLLSELGVIKSHSRPYVSDDNPYSESHFKTMKYRPSFPERFNSLQEARAFCQQFFTWYNENHQHSGIGYVTPEQMHCGTARAIVEARANTLQNAFEKHPNRFKNRIPRPPKLPTEAGINMPKTNAEDQIANVK